MPGEYDLFKNPSELRKLQRAADVILGYGPMDMSKGLNQIREAKKGVVDLAYDPQRYQRERLQFQKELGGVQDFKARQGQIELLIGELERAGDKERARKLKQLGFRQMGLGYKADLLEPLGQTKTSNTAAAGGDATAKETNPLIGTARVVGELLDIPQAQTTRRITQGFLDPSRSPLDREVMSPEQWTGTIQERAKDPAQNPISAGAWTAARTLAKPLSVPIGLTSAGLGMAVDVATGETKGMWDRAKEEFGRTLDQGAKHGLLIGTDPTLISGTMKHGAKALVGQIERLAVEAGLERGAARTLAREGAKRYLAADLTKVTPSGSFQAFEDIKGLLREAKIPEDSIARTLGGQGEFMARGQMSVQDPFGVFQKEIAPMFGLEQPLRKAAKLPYQGLPRLGIPGVKLASGREMPKWLDPRNVATQMKARQVRAGEALANRAFGEEMKGVAESAQGISPQRLDEMSLTHFDPAREGRGPFTPYEELAPQEKVFADSVRDITERRADEAAELGMLKKGDESSLGLGALNERSGYYFPRQYKGEHGMFDELVASRGERGYNPFASRQEGGGLALGEAVQREGVKAVTNPLEALTYYHGRTAALRAQKQFEDHLAGIALDVPEKGLSGLQRGWKELPNHPGKMVPAELYNIMTQNFERGTVTMAGAFRKAMPGLTSTLPGRGFLELLDWHRKAINRFKRMVLPFRPSYHAVNVANDSAYLVGLGMNNPVGWVTKSLQLRSKWLKAEAGDAKALAWLEKPAWRGGPTRRQVMETAQSNDVSLEGSSRLQLVGGSKKSQVKALGRIQQGKGPRTALGKVAGVGEDLTAAWNDSSKLAGYMFLLKQGENPARAAEQVMSHMIDYGKPGGEFDRGMQWLITFYKYARHAPEAGARAFLHRPITPNLLHRGQEAYFPITTEHEAPKYVSERGEYGQLGPTGERVVSGLRELTGGMPVPSFQDMLALTRNPFVEPYSQLYEASQGNIGPAMNMMHPTARYALEGAMGRDMLTKRELAPGRAPFNYGTLTPFVEPGSPWLDLEADPGQQSLMHYFAGMVAPPPLLLGANVLHQKAAGPGASLNIFGAQRDYDPFQQNQIAHQIISQGWGWPVYGVGPGSTLRNLTLTPEWGRVGRYLRPQRRQLENLARESRLNPEE